MKYVDKLKTLCDRSPSEIRKIIYFVYKNVLILPGILLRDAAIEKLRKNSAKCKTIEDYLDLTFSFKFGPFNVRPYQVREEISQLMKILAKLSPKVVLEIGTTNGGTLYLLSKVASSDATLISIDLPGGAFGGGYPRWKVPFYRSFSSKNQKIHLLRMDSHLETTLNKVKEILGNSKLDFLFIDGDHTYEGVKKDFKMYKPLVGKKGIIALHDINPDYGTRYGIETFSDTGDVPIFWKEIKNKCKFLEIIEKQKQDGYGIGVIYNQ